MFLKIMYGFSLFVLWKCWAPHVFQIVRRWVAGVVLERVLVERVRIVILGVAPGLGNRAGSVATRPRCPRARTTPART